MWLSGCGYNDHTDSPTPLSQNWQLCNLKMWSFVGSNLCTYIIIHLIQENIGESVGLVFTQVAQAQV